MHKLLDHALAAIGRITEMVAAIVIAFFLLAVMLNLPALAHSFYPWECCHDQDCWAAGPGEREPAPRLVGNGWQLADGTVVPFEAMRQSPDGRFHVCRRNGDPKGALITPHGKLPCLWVPEGGA